MRALLVSHEGKAWPDDAGHARSRIPCLGPKTIRPSQADHGEILNKDPWAAVVRCSRRRTHKVVLVPQVQANQGVVLAYCIARQKLSQRGMLLGCPSRS
jgi:hypothetical protein